MPPDRQLRPLPTTPAVSGVPRDPLVFCVDPGFGPLALSATGDVYGTTRLGHRAPLFIRGGEGDQRTCRGGDALEGLGPDECAQAAGAPCRWPTATAADHKARRRVGGQAASPASALQAAYSPAIRGRLVDDLNTSSSEEAPLGRWCPSCRALCHSAWIASTLLGLDPVDRDALFGGFRDLVPGPVLPAFALPGSPYAKSPSGPSAPAAAASARCQEGGKVPLRCVASCRWRLDLLAGWPR